MNDHDPPPPPPPPPGRRVRLSSFDNFFQEIKSSILDIARSEAGELVEQASYDGRKFVDALRDDLEVWTQQLASGELSIADFEFLVKGMKDVAEMNALTEAGLAAIRIERIRTTSINLIITAARKLV